MRLLTVLCVTMLLVCAAFGQHPSAYYDDGYGPYVPRVTTPQISLQTISLSPVGASNATYGLMAGARNSTLSMINGNTNSGFSEAVWYQGGGAPLISEPEISLYPRAVRGGYPPAMRHEEHAEAHMGAPRQWTFIAALPEGETPVEASSVAKSARHATRTITNDDIVRENQKTGTVKYDGKTEKLP